MNPATRQSRILQYMPLVWWCLKKYGHKFPEFEREELIAEAYVVLIRCVDYFDASKGFKFVTYAATAIFHRWCELLRIKKERFIPFDDVVDKGDEEGWFTMPDIHAVSPPRQAEAKELVEMLRHDLADDFPIMWGRCVEGRSLVEMAVPLGVSSSTLSARYCRALERAKKCLQSAGV